MDREFSRGEASPKYNSVGNFEALPKFIRAEGSLQEQRLANASAKRKARHLPLRVHVYALQPLRTPKRIAGSVHPNILAVHGHGLCELGG